MLRQGLLANSIQYSNQSPCGYYYPYPRCANRQFRTRLFEVEAKPTCYSQYGPYYPFSYTQAIPRYKKELRFLLNKY